MADIKSQVIDSFNVCSEACEENSMLKELEKKTGVKPVYLATGILAVAFLSLYFLGASFPLQFARVLLSRIQVNSRYREQGQGRRQAVVDVLGGIFVFHFAGTLHGHAALLDPLLL